MSPMTVSRAFTGKGYTAAATKERILGIAQRLDYRPNRVARSLVQSQTRTLGLMVNAGLWFTDVMRGADEVAREHGYSFIYTPAGHSSAVEREQIEILRERRVDGVLLVSGSEVSEHDHLRALSADGVPLVTINRYGEDAGAQRLFFDYRGAACAVIEQLLAAGHRQVAFLGGSPEHPQQAVREQIAGYREALQAAAAWEPTLELFGGYHPEAGDALVEDLLRREPRVTALLTVNDLTAAGALWALRRHHRRVPEDVAVISFDDTYIARCTDPPLTSVRHAMLAAGRTGCGWLIEQVEGQRDEARSLVLPSSLMFRRSCGLASPGQQEALLRHQ